MNFRFGIREKFALFAIVLVLAVALALPGYLSTHAHRVVEQHELVDLQDEAELRCWEIIDSVNQLRQQTVRLSTEPAALDGLLQWLTPPMLAPANGGEEAPDWRGNILAVRRMSASGGTESVFSHRGAPPLPEMPPGVLDAARDSPTAAISTILPLTVPSEFDPRRKGPADRAKKGSQRIIPVIWAAHRVAPGSDRFLAILLSLDRGRSPRHLSFLLDMEGRPLMHPFLKADGTPETIYRDIDLFKESDAMRRDQVWGRAAQDADMSTQRSDFPRERQAMAVPFHFLEGRLGDKLLEAFNAEYSTGREGLLWWGETVRMELERSGVPFGPAGKSSNVIRLLARSAPELDAARKAVEDAYASHFAGVNDKVVWNSPVLLKHGDIQLTRFHLEPPLPGATAASGAPYYFAYAAFREELASSITHEMESMRHAAVLLAGLAGVLAFLTAFYFVRPLTRITQTARSVTRSDGDAGQLQHQIEAVRGSLPVRRRDEVGDIARALESLLRQVLNGHEQLRQLNADLDNRVREQTAELREANEQLRGLAAAKDTFLASVSHELRQPLNSIFGFMQFLELSELDDEQRRDMGKLRAAAAYLRRLIDDILDYQKIIMGGVELEPETLDAGEFLTHLRDSMMPQAQEKKNRLEFRVAPGIGHIFNDRSRLQQVLVNLLSNACKFTQDGVVSLDARREKDATGKEWLVLDVSDTGRGMTPEEQQGLFVRFKKLSAREGNKTGTGLGLVISQGLCVLMGGSVTCRSEPGKGSTFTARVPASVPGEPAPAIERQVEAARPPARPDAPHPLVLVIDDDDGVRELMTRYLEAKGYRVMTADSGEEGVALAAAHHPAVITLDIVLAGEQNGWDVLAMLKAAEATAGIPVIIITFLDEPRHGMALGAADYIVKPIAWDALSASLQKVIPGARLEAPVLVVDDDPEVRELFRRTLARDDLAVIEAGNGAEALRILREQRPSVILLDLMMPVMDGFEFVSEFNQHPEWHGIPIIVVTARHITREDRQALAVSARAFLQKSGFTQEDMLAKVLELVHHHAGAERAG